MDKKAQIAQDLKTAMLSGDKRKVEALRIVKSAILDAEVSSGARESGLPEGELLKVLAKEAKKRQESIQLYEDNDNQVAADQEKYELSLIEVYLPDAMSDEELEGLVGAAITELGADGMKDMGKVIQVVKEKAGPTVDGGTLARLTKKALQQ